MSDHTCPHRTTAEAFARCRLVGDFVGDLGLCGVHESLCKACLGAGAPDLARPNPYIASVAYKACNANAKAAAGEGDQPRWFHWAGLAHFFRAYLMRKGRPSNGKEKPTPDRPVRCLHLSETAKERKPCNCPREHRYECGRFRDSVGSLPLLVSPNNECERCPGYEANPDDE